MHRTYSLRQSRAPTASQLQNPPPPPSTTKSGRLFGKGGFGHGLRKHAYVKSTSNGDDAAADDNGTGLALVALS